ncbi:hypothetical protein KIF53_18300 [Chromobacterium subtsugae]|uniref:Uncharacterized protein n=1 Tax=Chromobacterium subtsugae TaxID=251747 RepID=A0ABS7FHN5_9NEIS|nr:MULTISPECIES: hypothetical protein [Chromobacterium]MBW7568417.1 hypothetical protein [Chromobacterium subtsugae]MBW8289592.1 hypothetical protein [Chromobacterium subtsugae]WSE92592.1 hypothetical protein U6115_04890 [Chromobacterium subtsugae]WVH60970.1 hypothetical protein U6151_04910 [Chromobacterium subtsugae]
MNAPVMTPAVESAPRFDDNGRCLPHPATQAACHRQTRRYFLPHQPRIDYAAIHQRISRHLGAAEGLDAAAFEQRARAILAKLESDADGRRLLNGAHVPFFLPQAAHDDIGQALDERYLPAVKSVYDAELPQYSFVNHHKPSLSGLLTPTEGARHDRLIEAMRQGPVVGFYFPCLLEYSVPAAIEQLETLPAPFLLAGGYDSCAAFIGSPDLLLRKEGYPPLLWLSGLEAERAGVGYHFEAYGYDLTFNRRVHNDQAAEYWASALVVLG